MKPLISRYHGKWICESEDKDLTGWSENMFGAFYNWLNLNSEYIHKSRRFGKTRDVKHLHMINKKDVVRVIIRKQEFKCIY